MRTWCTVSVDNLIYNIEQIKKKVSPNVKLCGVIKADAYGHGAYEIAKELLKQGFEYLAVAFIDEAVDIRNNGINAPILILGNTPKDTISELIEYNVTATVYDFETAKAISEEAKKHNTVAKIHIKTDTGMSRIGFLPNSAGIEDIVKISKLPNIEIEGIFTHFACADEENDNMTKKQFEKFMYIINELKSRGINIPVKHCCNSAGTIKYPDMQLDMVRLGIILYGMYPSEAKYNIDLKPVMQFKTKVINIKTLKAGETISYGATYKLKKDTKVATIAVGYADGYSRLLSNKGRVLVNGQFANILGRICMDQCMIDVTDVNNISIGDDAVLFGTDKNAELPIEELAAKIGTINYELTCVINKRVPRCYTKNKAGLKTENYLLPVKSL
ncbi:MAG: alanine racemase [Clostridia bacterium]|nr:alanine racemase [Clostridia bacterium]